MNSLQKEQKKEKKKIKIYCKNPECFNHYLANNKIKVKETKKQTDKRIKCIYCKKPIHIDNFAGMSKKGMICGDIVCLTKLAKELKK